ncbi:hypothetical protein B296_00040894 [Ensete ventricosum]|uniref:Uncharacterized protein n=1 Tax=Ensete ventricosum TaxID=4639 RepID=A0A426XET4_ENSVE|nr:hypothetical protein B296_00040894 [Ensete ventricosum]
MGKCLKENTIDYDFLLKLQKTAAITEIKSNAYKHKMQWRRKGITWVATSFLVSASTRRLTADNPPRLRQPSRPRRSPEAPSTSSSIGYTVGTDQITNRSDVGLTYFNTPANSVEPKMETERGVSTGGDSPERLPSEHPGLAHHGGVLHDLEAELSGLLGGVDLGLPRRRQQLEVLHQAAQGDADDGEGEDDAGAAAAAGAEGQVAEVVAAGLHLGLLLHEALRAELLGPVPVGGVVGKPPCVDQDLALAGDVVAAEPGVVEVHVGDEEGDGHPVAQRLLHHRLEVGQPLQVRLRDLVASQHRVQLRPKLALDLRVVHQLRDPPLDRPQRRLQRCINPPTIKTTSYIKSSTVII